jgi:hypothetical protein
MSHEQPMTMGEAVDRHGPSEAFVAIADLAHAVGRIPIGEWSYGPFTTDPRFSLWVNGGREQHWQPVGCSARIDRFYAYVECDGWPAALLCPAGGAVTMPEGDLIDALNREVKARQTETF